MRVRLIVIATAVALSLTAVLTLSGRDESPPAGPDRPTDPLVAHDRAIPALDESKVESAPDETGAVVVLASVPAVPVTTAVDGVPSASRRGMTDAEGQVFFEGLPAGRTVSVKVGGGYFRYQTVAVDVKAGETTEVPIRLDRGGVLAGRATDKDGLPIASTFTVSITPWNFPRYVASRSFPAGTTEFEIDGLPAGSFVAHLSVEGYVDGRSPRFTVRVGETTSGIRLALGERFSIIRGIVLNQGGEPLSGWAVDLWHDGEIRQERTGDRGGFAYDRLAPGKVLLRVGTEWESVELGTEEVRDLVIRVETGRLEAAGPDGLRASAG